MKRNQIKFSFHSLEQCRERGTTRNEVEEAILSGSVEKAKLGRIICYYNFTFQKYRNGTFYSIKQVAPVIKEEVDQYVVITVYVFYF